ncbi:MAG: hypothetical protein IIC95_03265 [Chloroflexi bacterium]|nr:hypothetical protein [Chloroflexota bacterium]MCH7654988.1 hypothetical protein [Chloroflexota bacterium]
MSILQAQGTSNGESGAAQRAAQVRTRIAAFLDLSILVRGEDTGLVLETMEAYAAHNGEPQPAPERA